MTSREGPEGSQRLSDEVRIYMDAFIAEERPAPGRRMANWSAIEAALAARRWRVSWSWLAVVGLGFLCGLSFGR